VREGAAARSLAPFLTVGSLQIRIRRGCILAKKTAVSKQEVQEFPRSFFINQRSRVRGELRDLHGELATRSSKNPWNLSNADDLRIQFHSTPTVTTAKKDRQPVTY
jgi:hypothetical protein